MQQTTQRARDIERALADSEFDGSQEPVICFEINRSTPAAANVAPVCVAINLTRDVTHGLAFARAAVVQYGLDIAGVDLDQHVAWGASEDDDGDAFDEARINVVRHYNDDGLVVLVTGRHTESGTAIESICVPLDTFLLDVANGRRAFAESMDGDELLEEAAPCPVPGF